MKKWIIGLILLVAVPLIAYEIRGSITFVSATLQYPLVTGIVTSTAAFDDGYYRVGVAAPSPRFIPQANTNVILDSFTGLMWAQNQQMYSSMPWTQSLATCESLEWGGYTDWRLPNIRELLSVFMWNQAYPGVPPYVGNSASFRLWSSSPVWGSANGIHTINPRTGVVDSQNGLGLYGLTWPVRGP